MTGYHNIEELKQHTYFYTATLDDKFVFELVDEGGAMRPATYRMTGCAHRDRDGVLCTTCGETVK